MPSRSPLSATRNCAQGHKAWIAAKIAQPGSSEVGAVPPDRPDRRAAVMIEPDQTVDDGEDVRAGVPARIDARAGIAFEPHRDRGQASSPCPRCRAA